MDQYINKVIQGDCLEVLKILPENSVDSIVTDPPYELGFMGKSWDNTGIANNKDMWGECLRVLKPGGHLLAFSGTRTYHRMAVAIEDAGFEVRDMIEYIYGSGFPKSLNIQKHLLKKYGYGNMGEYETTQQKTQSQMQDVWKAIISKTLAQKENNDRRDLSDLLEDLDKGTQHKIFTHPRSESKIIPFSERQRQSCLERWGDLPTPQGELYCKCQICEMPTGLFVNGKKRWVCYGTQTNNGETSWEVIDENGVCSSYKSQAIGQSLGELNVVCEQCDAQAIRGTGGFGTALKPSHEPICMARKPLAEKTVAENVLKYGTGGINIDESRVESSEVITTHSNGKGNTGDGGIYGHYETVETGNERTGRFPANLIHDNSEEVREFFPETGKGGFPAKSSGTTTVFNGGNKHLTGERINYDSGNASRFFKSIIYQAKASKSERNMGCEGLEEKNASKMSGGEFSNQDGTSTTNHNRLRTNHHPTVKPIALMEYLIKMVTPKGRIVLDPFAGSGTTLVAAKQNGFQYIGIELTPEYIPIIEARLTEITTPLF